MKFSSALLSSVAACLLSSVVTAARDVPASGAVLEARQGGRFGGNPGGQGRAGNAGGAKAGANTASAKAAAAATSTTAAAAAASSAATNNAKNTGGSGNTGGGNPQTSLTLDPSVINKNFASTGQAGTPEAGQVASLTSTNNFINFCVGKTLTNGQQVKTGSCNSAPMGDLPSTANQPSSKFTSPLNMGNVAANTAFTVKMAVQSMETGNFVNAQTNYFAAPQQLNGQGLIVAHSHIVIQQLKSMTDTTILNPTTFAFFQGLNAAAVGGVLSATVTGGLPAGVYKISSINTSANHAPVVGPVAQHGTFDDQIYITVGGNGAAAAGGNAGGNAGTQTTTSAAAASTSARAGAGKGKGGKKFVRRFGAGDVKARLAAE